jgi:hypothetical protein
VDEDVSDEPQYPSLAARSLPPVAARRELKLFGIARLRAGGVRRMGGAGPAGKKCVQWVSLCLGEEFGGAFPCRRIIDALTHTVANGGNRQVDDQG